MELIKLLDSACDVQNNVDVDMGVAITALLSDLSQRSDSLSSSIGSFSGSS